MVGVWKPEYGRAYQERQRTGARSTYWNAQTWEERLERKVVRSAEPNGCWIWIAAKDSRGYGIAQLGGRRSTTAHRDVYRHLVGPIPEGMELDHLCRVRACVNPAHMEVVTHAENSRRASHWWGTKPACKRGHLFTPENTATRAGRSGRSCRACNRERMVAYRERRRAAA